MIVFTGKEDDRTFRDKARIVIQKYLTENPGSPRDKVFDVLVSHLIRRGEMERHDFDQLLRLYAEPAGDDPNRWYSKSEDIDASEAVKEEETAAKLAPILKKYLKEHPEEDGIRYSDLFEAYLYAVPSDEKPKRELREFILDFRVRTPDGAYRPPADEQERDLLAQARKTGANRRIRRFLKHIDAGVVIPADLQPNDATLAEWVRHCKRAGLYEQGKLLYERGGLDVSKLSEELAVGVEEDYRVCVRMLARGTASALGKAKKGR